jgi:hypothetical protein
VNTRIAKDVSGLRATTAGCDAIRSADIPPTCPMLDRHAERHFMRLVTQYNTNSDLIPDEPDGMVDEEDIQILDSWTDRVVEDLWVLGDDVEQSVPVDLEFALWHETASIDHHENHTEGYHGYTDGSRRISAAFGWSLHPYNDQGKQVEVKYNKGCLGELKRHLTEKWKQLPTLWNTSLTTKSQAISQSTEMHKQPSHELGTQEQVLGKSGQLES